MSVDVEAPPTFLCSSGCPLAGGNLLTPREECAAYSSLSSALHHHFGFESFKPGQLEVLLPVHSSLQVVEQQKVAQEVTV